MYHSVSNSANPRFEKFAIAPSQFAEQMNDLRRRGYQTLTITQLVETLNQRRPLPQRVVVLTFDDGFADFYDEAMPVLKRLGFTATLYVATGFVGQTSAWLQKENESNRQMLTWDQLAKISAQGIECGAHSHTHVPLDVLTPDQARAEIQQSKQMLEDRLGVPARSFAYPFGYYNPTVRQIVRVSGFTSACAVRYASSSTHDDPWALARLIVSGASADFGSLLIGAGSVQQFERTRSSVWRLARRSALGVKHALRA